jgi:hypothetical protein
MPAESVDSTTHNSTKKKVLRAPYETLYLIAEAKKPHTIGKSLIMHVAIKITKIMHEKK